MALIKCPECGKEISDKASACIHCGCPIEQKIYEIIDGKQADITFLLDNHIEKIVKIKMLREKYGCDLVLAKNIADKYCPIESVTQSTPSNTLKCPKCGSTAVTTCARGVNGFWGFIGAGKTVNRCGNCGHTWKPRG